MRGAMSNVLASKAPLVMASLLNDRQTYAGKETVPADRALPLRLASPRTRPGG